MKHELSGAVVVVVGASGGLGTPLCEQLAAAGSTVVTASRQSSADVQVDVRDATAGAHIVEHVRAQHGRLDGVIVAAGIVAFGDLTDTSDVTIEELFLTNAMAPLWLAQNVASLLQESQGFFANISGVVADTPMPGMAAYSASKAAAAAALVAVRKEWRRKKIDVIDIRPPHTETGLATRPLEGVAPQMPDGLQPAQVASTIVAAIANGTTDVSAGDFGNL